MLSCTGGQGTAQTPSLFITLSPFLSFSLPPLRDGHDTVRLSWTRTYSLSHVLSLRLSSPLLSLSFSLSPFLSLSLCLSLFLTPSPHIHTAEMVIQEIQPLHCRHGHTAHCYPTDCLYYTGLLAGSQVSPFRMPLSSPSVHVACVQPCPVSVCV